ncbi:MAG: hypothetical protein KAR23_02505 [Candidatus Aenigmarchaeota archaeon]|nr:hypothetical protein [Candidatus Aenigmarchaeota archaeon]MCK5234918.1 hypothetical protein [Candidatus Aenigmarchaeota archaeon]
MPKESCILDTIKIGAGFIGIKEGIETFALEDIYTSALGCPDMAYSFARTGAELMCSMPEYEILAGFTIGVFANLTAGFIKSEYGSLSNFIRRKRLADEYAYSRFR